MEWGEKDSNLRSLATTELQSVPFGHSGIPPFFSILKLYDSIEAVNMKASFIAEAVRWVAKVTKFVCVPN